MPDEKTGRLDEDYVVQMKGITKVYPNGVAANQGVDFNLRRGEIHALMGENGAGKSTLMKMLFGLEQPTSGEIWVNGEKLSLTSPTVAISHGIGMVHQHFMLVPSFTVAQNIVMSREPRRLGVLFDNKAADGLRSSLNNVAGAGASTPSAVFSSDVSGAGAAKQQPAAAANSAAKPVEEESSDNRYYDELLAILNKRK